MENTNSKTAKIKEAIAVVRERWGWVKDNNAAHAALGVVRWRLRGPNGEFVGLDSRVRCSFVPESEALVFDGRDNEDMKLATYESALGPLTVEIQQAKFVKSKAALVWAA